MKGLCPDSFANGPINTSIRVLSVDELKEQAANLRHILADGDCIDLGVLEPVLEIDDDEGPERDFSRAIYKQLFYHAEEAFWGMESLL